MWHWNITQCPKISFPFEGKLKAVSYLSTKQEFAPMLAGGEGWKKKYGAELKWRHLSQKMENARGIKEFIFPSHSMRTNSSIH